MRAPYLLTAVILAALAFAPATAQAGHWCNETLFDLNPPIAFAGIPSTMVLTIENAGTETTTLTSVEVQVEWETSWRSLGGASLGPGGLDTFTFTVTPPAARSYSVNVRVQGTNTGDTPATPTTCNRQLSIDATPTGPGTPESIFAGFVMWLIVIVVIIVVVVVVVVVLAVRAGKPKGPQQPPYQPPYQPPPPPYQPPAQPPPSP